MSYRRRAGLNQLGPPPRVPTSGPFVSGTEIFTVIGLRGRHIEAVRNRDGWRCKFPATARYEVVR